MNSKRILLISLLVIMIAAISMGTIAAASSEDINTNNTIAANDIHNTAVTASDISDMETTASDIQDTTIAAKDLESDNIASTDSQADLRSSEDESKISSTEIEEAKLENTGNNNLLGTVITIDGSANNQMDEPTIQTAINNAKDGDTIIITGTSYVHCHFRVDKKLTIKSEVGTIMTPCGSIEWSNKPGIFYITSKGSGTVIEGFTFNNIFNGGYGVYVDGASNVEIKNCTMNRVANGVLLRNAKNTKISDSKFTDCTNAINLTRSNNTIITGNIIQTCTLTGINIGLSNQNTYINFNNITNNKGNGITLNSAEYVYITNNYILNNTNNGEHDAGVYVDCTVTKVNITGNVMIDNGKHAVYLTSKASNVVIGKGNENLVFFDNNYLAGHEDRIIYSFSAIVYLRHVYDAGIHFICDATLYKATSSNKYEKWSANKTEHQLVLTEISQTKKGVYTISIVDVNGNPVTDFDNIYVNFYLNKNNTFTDPQNGDTYITVRMQDGTATADFRKLYYLFEESGNNITAAFPSKDGKLDLKTSKTFNVSDSDIPPEFRETTLSASSMTVLAKSGKYFTVTLKDSTNAPVEGETIIFKISGVSTTYNATTDKNGQARIPINMAAGTYTITATHIEEGSYGESSAKATVTVYQLASSIKSSNMKLDTIYGKEYSITLRDSNGNAISGQKVTFSVNKKTYKATTNSKGVAKVKIKIKKNGKYKITIKFAGAAQYKAASAKKTITVKIGSTKTKLALKKLTTYPDSGKYYSAKLTTKKGKAIKGQKITFTVNGNTYIKKTNKKGVAKFKIAIIKTGKYKVTARYNGTSKYRGTTKKNYIKIKTGSKKAKIVSKNVYMNPNSGEYYSITLKNNKGKAMKKAIIRFTVNKKTYKVKTNSKGVAKVKINLNSGKYSIKTQFAGNSKFKAKTASNTINVRTKTAISSNDANYTYLSEKPYSVVLKDASGKAVKGKTIYFTVNNKQYNAVTDANGAATVQLNLPIGNYTITSKFNTDNDYVASSKTSRISVENASIILETYDKTYASDSKKTYHAIVKDEQGNPYKSQNVVFTINGAEINASTNDNGVASIELDLSENAEITSSIYVDYRNETLANTNQITVTDDVNKTFIDAGLSNDEIQNTINDCLNDTNLEFLGTEYSDVNLIINKTLSLIPATSTVLNGANNSVVLTLLEGASGSSIKNFIITANSGSGIAINGAKDISIDNNIIANALEESLIDDYNNGSTYLPGKGINIANSSNANISNNEISYFESGVFVESSDNINTSSNTITKNNYGITYGKDVANTSIEGNKIFENIGWLVMDVPEGPNGYGIYINESAVNLTITENNITDNYLGISFDASESEGISVTRNLISGSVTEGIRFNAGFNSAYDDAENAPIPYVADNAVYRNAKGPSLWILGEMSANPNGIYGPGQWNESKRLLIEANWYGDNELRTWDEESGIVGIGTMCPRIKTYAIYFDDLTYVSEGVYNISFYKGIGDDKEVASNLGTFDMYATLNNGTENAVEYHFLVENGVGTIIFDTSSYQEGNNKIDISVGSLSDSGREYVSLLTYNITA